MNERLTLQTSGRPQEIIAAAVRRGETVDTIFLSWLWGDFQALRARLASLEAQAGAAVALLSRLEWDHTDRCDICGGVRWKDGHRGDCALAAALAADAGQHAARLLALVAEWVRANAEHYAYWQSMGYSPIEREREEQLRERVHDVQIRLLATARETLHEP